MPPEHNRPRFLDHRHAITWVTGTSPHEAVEASSPGIAAASPCGADRSTPPETPVGSDAPRDQRLNHASTRGSANNEDTWSGAFVHRELEEAYAVKLGTIKVQSRDSAFGVWARR